MFENIYFSNVDKYIENDRYTIWKFPATSAFQKRPILYITSLYMRAYYNYFSDKTSLIPYLNQKGFDVYLLDWGKSDSVFTLQNWTLEIILQEIKEIIELLIQEYKVKNINIFGIGMGAILSFLYLLFYGEKHAEKIHRLAFFSAALWGSRNLGMEKAFYEFFDHISPFKEFFAGNGIPSNLLHLCILLGNSYSMIEWNFKELYKHKLDYFQNFLLWLSDEKLIPYDIFEKMVQLGQSSTDYEVDIQNITKDIHLLNIVAENDLIVTPPASIIEYDAVFPHFFKSFKQIMIGAGHYFFALPEFQAEKTEIANWFAGEDFDSLVHKLPYKTNEYTEEIIKHIKRKIKFMNPLQKYLLIERLENTSIDLIEDIDHTHINEDLELLKINMLSADENELKKIQKFLKTIISPILPYISDIKIERNLLQPISNSHIIINNLSLIVHIHDISCEGMGLYIEDENNNSLNLQKNDLCEIDIKFKETQFILKAIVRWIKIEKIKDKNYFRLGLKFESEQKVLIEKLIQKLKDSHA